MAEEAGDGMEALFHEAADLPPEERQALLERACANNPELRAALERLLAEDGRLGGDEAGPFLLSPLILPAPLTIATPARAHGPTLPSHLGNYRIIRLIGEGGMGAVYEAEQDNPRRTAALKVVRPGLASPLFLKRFHHEGQILGRLHHPGIAQVYEAGLADDGQPFFAMEFIRGLSLDEYARFQAPALRARVELVARVCDAVQHAHDQGIIHRDLKPANILVEETGQPKVLDFGVARALDADLFTGGGLTQTGQMLGTPNYMSPEQVTGDNAAIDGRADVYALGMILFELAAHRLPYALANRPLVETARIILEVDPPRLGLLDPALRGDVETIVAKALAKDPARRYASTAELAADLRRWLAHEPILARPPSLVYQTRMFVRRNKALVGSMVGIALALVAGTIVSTLFAFGEANERRQAVENSNKAETAREKALAETYQARTLAALAALNEHDAPQARRHLDAAPVSFRRWEWYHLRSRLDESSRQFHPTGTEVHFVYYAAGWRGLIATSAGTELWDLQTDQRLAILSREPRTQVVPLLCKGGARFLLDPVEGPLQLVDDTGQALNQFGQLKIGGRLKAAALSPDGRWLAVPSGPESPFAVVLDVETGRQVTSQLYGATAVLALAFSPEIDHLVGGGSAGVLRVWEVATSKQLASMYKSMAHTSAIRSICFSPDGSRFVSASNDQSFRQWDAKTYRLLDVRHPGSAVAMATYSPDGRWLATATRDRALMLWSAEGGEAAGAWHGHTADISQLSYRPDGLELASVGKDGVRFWELPGGGGPGVLRAHTSFVYAVACSSDGKSIASAGWDKVIRLWDARSGEQITALPGHTDWIASLAFCPDGRRLVSRAKDASIRVWDMATGQCLASLKDSLVDSAASVQNVAVSPDGKLLAAAVESRVRFWDMDTYQEKRDLTLPVRFLRIVAFSPDQQRLAIAGSKSSLFSPGIICLIRLDTGQVEATIEAHSARIHGLVFSPDGRRLVSTSSDRTARIWDVQSGQLVRQLDGHFDEVFAAAFHPDGRRLATAGRDRIIRLWDPETGEQVSQLRGHTEYVFSLDFSQDGSTLVSGSGDFTVRLWDTFPASQRYEARESLRAVRPQAQKLVDGLMQELGDPVAAARKLQTDPPHDQWLRRAAEHELLRRSSENPRH